MKAFIMRGLPGSGKSTIASMLSKTYNKKDCEYHTTDSFHIVDGEYKYDAGKAHEYHDKNLVNFSNSCRHKVAAVICDNTNINSDQYQPYVDAAEKYGYTVYLMTVGDFDVDKSFERTVHKVPKDERRF